MHGARPIVGRPPQKFPCSRRRNSQQVSGSSPAVTGSWGGTGATRRAGASATVPAHQFDEHLVELPQGELLAEAHDLLAGLGHLFDGAIFGGPTYRLSSRHPFQATPLARLSAIHPLTYVTAREEIAWSQARVPSGLGTMRFHFDEPPQGKCMATISLLAVPWDGATGHVTLKAHGSTVSIPITAPVNRSIELIFTPPAGGPADVTMTIEPGVQILAFFFMTLGPAPLVFTRD